MSQENVEIVRRGYEHFIATGELPSATYDPEFVWDMSNFRGWPERQTYAGVEGAMEFLAAWREAWEEWEIEVEDYIDGGGELVVTIVRQQGRSTAGGAPVVMRFGQVWTIRNGIRLRMEMYASREEALEAAGLGERA